MLSSILAALVLAETYSVVYRVFENFAVGFFLNFLSFSCHSCAVKS